eukprot:CAMPEP_0205926834 /NCGR_PEP_ID=MMETSP1325-20131115/21305_1 /ASSEMBLY_ACC=CAM_ASM_000708 /TAXON_ID=236786 /ORGANISM="Florenciella sp., Strain RCC1007" /LENGTH=60 /DNA_ID=CAMNT_0053295611 /DNA_START=520 /DNA_END=698 /DNA_ORIENTATION=-
MTDGELTASTPVARDGAGTRVGNAGVAVRVRYAAPGELDPMLVASTEHDEPRESISFVLR